MSNDLCSLRELYALGGLDEIENTAFESHIAECKACREEVANLKQVADDLLLDFDLVDPPSGMRDRILQNVFAEDPRQQVEKSQPMQTNHFDIGLSTIQTHSAPRVNNMHHSREKRWVPWASAAAVCIVVIGGASLWGLNRPTVTPIGTVETQIALQATTNQGSANMIVTKGSSGSEMFLRFSNLKPVSGTQVYQVWLIQNGSRPQSAGVFTPDDNGNAVFASLIPQGNYQTVAVTLEPKAIDQQPLGQMQFKASL